MNKLWKTTKKICLSVHNIIKGIMSSITEGTSSAMSLLGETITAIVTIVTTIGIFTTILLVSLPIGIFEGIKN